MTKAVLLNSQTGLGKQPVSGNWWEPSLKQALGYSKVKLAKPSSQGLVKSHQRKSLFFPELIDMLALDGHVMQVIWAGMHSKGFQRMQFAFKKHSRLESGWHIQVELPWQKLSSWTHKLGWESSLFPATDESQVSNKRWGIQKLSWQCLQFKESSIIVTGKISFLPGLIDVAFLGWACHAGHLGRHAFEGIPEDAACLQKTFKTGVGLTHSSWVTMTKAVLLNSQTGLGKQPVSGNWWEPSLKQALGYSKVKLAKPSSQGLVKSHQRKSLFLPELIDMLALDGHVMQKVIGQACVCFSIGLWTGMVT